MTLCNLGNALNVLGAHKQDNDLRREAVDAYRAALTELTPQNSPQQWAKVQSNLANALSFVGQRKGSPQQP